MEKINILPDLKIEELRQENIKMVKIITELERDLRITSKDLYDLKQKHTKLQKWK